MLVFDKTEIREALDLEDIFSLLQEWGGDPEYTSFGIVSSTICHNPPGEGSRKLYYYQNTTLFHCFTGCEEPSFDIFQLMIKVADIQLHKKFDLNDAVRFIALKFGIISSQSDEDNTTTLPDWEILDRYARVQEVEVKNYQVELKAYDEIILNRLNYNVKIAPWENEGIAPAAIEIARIGFFPGGDQITIPHYDAAGRFVGMRGRSLCKDEAERFGKYRPLKINNQLYSHPLGMNLYGLNWAKKNIKTMEKAIVFESERIIALVHFSR